MNTTMVKMETKDHKGPLQFTIQFTNKVGDLICSVHSISKVSLENFVWQFKDKKKMIMRPFRAFDENLLSGKQTLADVDKNLWQPDAIYAQFFS